MDGEQKQSTTQIQKPEKAADVFAQVFTEETSPTSEASAQKKPRGPQRTYRTVPHGRAYIQATYNNTIVTLTDTNGNALSWSSAGSCGFKGPKKATAYAAGVLVRRLAEKVQPYGLRDVDVFVKGVGSGREAAIRALNAQGFQVLSIKDITPIPHNGCRRRKVRRV